jgi:heme A synthase
MALALIAPGFLVVVAGLACYFIKMGENERSNYMATIVLAEIMFLVMLSGILPISRDVPLIMYLFLAYIFILAFLAWWVLLVEGVFVREREYFESLKPK